MKQKYRHTLVAAVFAGLAFSASAQNLRVPENADVPLEQDVIAESAEACPGGTIPSTPAYGFQDGRLVQNGWVCESLYPQSD